MTPRISVVLLLSVFAAGMLAGCVSQVNRANHDKVETDMTVEKARNILGEPAETAGGGASVAGISLGAEVMTWKDGDKFIKITFVNDKVTAKVQNGL